MKDIKKINLEKLRTFLKGLSTHEAFENAGKGVDNSNAIIFAYKGRNPPVGEYFLCDCIGNTVDLCKSTKRKFKNADGRLVNCKVIETIITDARKQLGSPVNNCWLIPYDLIK
jgi:hypothetical protein